MSYNDPLTPKSMKHNCLIKLEADPLTPKSMKHNCLIKLEAQGLLPSVFTCIYDLYSTLLIIPSLYDKIG